ncbi:hypothetical protein ACP4OV_024843 [Aristida adscensionis]
MPIACNLAFWRPGMDAYWLGCQYSPGVVIQDIIYCKSLVGKGFHVITDTEDLLLYHVITDSKQMVYTRWTFVKRMDHHLIQPEHSVSRYLVESRGKLLMVLREYSNERGVARRTSTFRIFEIQLETSPHSDVISSLWVEGGTRAAWTGDFPRLRLLEGL